MTSPASAHPFIEVYGRLRSSLTQLSQSLNTSTSTAELLTHLKTLDSRIALFDLSAARATTAEKAKVSGWEDELDRAGTLLWNRSTAMRHAVERGDPEVAAEQTLEVVAELRRAGYRLIRLGSLLPLKPNSHLSLLTLATKTSLALLSINQRSAADALVKEAGAHAGQLERHASTDSIVLRERSKALVAFYCCRIRVSVAGHDGLGGWLRGRAEELVKAGNVSWREVDRLAETAYDVAVIALTDNNNPSPGNEVAADTEDAIEWLQFAFGLLESGQGATVTDQQVVVMKALAEAYIMGKRWSEAEETIKQILDVRPSGELRRRQIKLLLARKAGDGEVVAAFGNAAKAFGIDETEDARCVLPRTLLGPPTDFDPARLIALVTTIPEERRIVRFKILKDLVASGEMLARLKAGRDGPLNQLFTTAIFFLDETDRSRFQDLLDSVVEIVPTARLASTTSFLCVTYLWRQGDKAHNDGRYVEAADWFLLATHSAFGAVDPVVFAKTIRKAALALIEARENARAEQVLQLPAAGGDYAKTHFVRFYNYSMLNQTAKSSAALEAMATALDFSPQLLLWAAKTANEANNKELLAAVLQKLVDVCKSGAGLSGVDLMVVIRCLIRLYLAKINEADDAQMLDFARVLHAHLDAALVLARDLAVANPPPDSLNKDVAWLYKSSFNLCARFSSRLPLDLLVSLYSLTASLIELEVSFSTSTVESHIVGKLWVCKFAALSGQVETARKAPGAEQVNLYRSLVVSASSFIEGITAASSSSSSASPPAEKTESILDAAYAVKIEALAAEEDWKGLDNFVEHFEDTSRPLPVSLLNLAVDKATSSTTCPREELCSILRKTLVLLYSRQDLDVASMARWLRLIISALVDKQPDAALEYVKNAESLIEANQDKYPQEEIDWYDPRSPTAKPALIVPHPRRLLSVVWDYGVDAYHALLLPVGQSWCAQAVKIAVAAGEKRAEGMAQRLVQWHDSLKERFGGVVGSEGEDIEMA
ncbi:hypothetical protein JCM11251_007519 [Rhodosporidiobolus azoricus]